MGGGGRSMTLLLPPRGGDGGPTPPEHILEDLPQNKWAGPSTLEARRPGRIARPCSAHSELGDGLAQAQPTGAPFRAPPKKNDQRTPSPSASGCRRHDARDLEKRGCPGLQPKMLLRNQTWLQRTCPRPGQAGSSLCHVARATTADYSILGPSIDSIGLPAAAAATSSTDNAGD